MINSDGAKSDPFPLPVPIKVRDGARQWTYEYAGTSMIVIGRADDCDITVETTKASRHHAYKPGNHAFNRPI